MESTSRPQKSIESKVLQALASILIFSTLVQGLEYQDWVLIRTKDGTVIGRNTSWWALGPSCISLTADFSKFFEDEICDSELGWGRGPSNSWKYPGWENGPLDRPCYGTCGAECDTAQKNKNLWYSGFYVCPEPPKGKRWDCGGASDYYCSRWGCETIVSGNAWAPGGGRDKYISFEREKGPKPHKERDERCAKHNCNPIRVTVLNAEDPVWAKGITWGVRLYLTGTDPGTLFTIKKLPTKNPPILKRLMEQGLPPQGPEAHSSTSGTNAY